MIFQMMFSLLIFSLLSINASTRSTISSLQNIQRLAAANNILAFNVHKQLIKDEGNIFTSPLSISTALAMLYLGTRGKSAEQMAQVLGYKDAEVDLDSVHLTHKQLLEFLGTPKDEYALSIANTMMVQSSFPVLPEYKDNIRSYYNALLQEVDFVNEAEKAKDEVNAWVSKNTNGKIEEILQEPPSKDTRLMLLNAVYFKGAWEAPFDPDFTMPRPFFNKGDTASKITVPMMNIKTKFPYVHIQHVKVKAVKLPYVGNDISMIIILPDEQDGLDTLERRLSPKDIEHIRIGMKETKVNIFLPKFKLEYSKTLREIFTNLGMDQVFGPNADLSGIDGDPSGLYVSQIRHKAVIEVNEEGSEAAGVTDIEIENRMGDDSPVFNANRPFLFLITDEHTGLILFMGSVREL